MKKLFTRSIPVLVLLTLVLSACGGGESPATAAIEATRTSAPPPADTAVVIPPTETLVPTPDNRLAATPTIPAVIMTPGKMIAQSDYEYYEQLLLIKGDANPPVSITQSYGLNMTPCETCELGFGTIEVATHTEKALDITIQVALYRFASTEIIQTRIAQEIADIQAQGGVQAEIPAGAQLPPETYIFTINQGGTGVLIYSFYQGFEVFIAQGNLADMTDAELIDFFCRLAELQISKLVAAGY